MKKQLLIDSSFFKELDSSNLSLELYTGRLLQGFRNSDVFEVSAIVWRGFESRIDELAGYEVPKIIIDGHHYVTPWPVVDRLLGLVSSDLIKELQKRNVDIVLVPYSFLCRLFFPKRFHQHVIVHDLDLYSYIKDRWGMCKYLLWRNYHHLLLHKVSNYISISEATRQELKRLDGIDSTIVHNSIPFDFTIMEEPVKEVEGRPYILDVNRFSKNKNTGTLIRAFSLLKKRIPHYLYLKGDNYYQIDELQDLAKMLDVGDRVIFDRTFRTESEMRYLYAHADLFVSPSLVEGFGWTPIEAAIMKVPVMVSDVDVLKEVTCEKVPTFDPYSPEDLAEKMLTILKNPPSRESREELSRFYQEKYSLKRQIDSMTDLFLQNLKAKHR